MGWSSTRHLRYSPPPHPHPCCCSRASRSPKRTNITISSSSTVSASSSSFGSWFRVKSRFLVLVLLLCKLVISTAMGVPVGEISHVNHRALAAEHPQRGGVSDHAPLSVTRLQRLQNVCSGNFLQIVDKSVNARARADSPFAIIRVESATNGTVRLRSQSSRVFLCFNKMGSIVIRYKAGKDRLCLFREHYMTDSHVTQYQSAEHATWWLGFSTSGGALSGSQWQRNPRKWTRCLRFAKIASSSSRDANSGDRLLHEAATSDTYYRFSDAWSADSQSPLGDKSADLHRPMASLGTAANEMESSAVKTRLSDDKQRSVETGKTVVADTVATVTKHHGKHRTRIERVDKKKTMAASKQRAAKQQTTTGTETGTGVYHVVT